MTKDPRALRSDESLAVELTAALKQGKVERLSRLLAANPSLTLYVVQEPKGGSRTWHEAALGLMPAIMQRVEAGPPPRPEEISGAFWNACHGGQLVAAQYLRAHGADLNWSAPRSGQTPLDIAEQTGRSDVAAARTRRMSQAKAPRVQHFLRIRRSRWHSVQTADGRSEVARAVRRTWH
jgi:hypothetical protein